MSAHTLSDAGIEPRFKGTSKLQLNDQLLNCSLKHEIDMKAVEWMAPIVQRSLAAGQQVVAFPIDLPTLCATSVAWIGESLQALLRRPELIHKVRPCSLHPRYH